MENEMSKQKIYMYRTAKIKIWINMESMEWTYAIRMHLRCQQCKVKWDVKKITAWNNKNGWVTQWITKRNEKESSWTNKKKKQLKTNQKKRWEKTIMLRLNSKNNNKRNGKKTIVG